MKKIISILLVFALVFSISVPVFAAEKDTSEECQNLPVIVVRGMDFGGLYVDYGTENQKPAINADVGNIIKGVLKILVSGIFNFSFVSFRINIE